jgi:hypothetical protein
MTGADNPDKIWKPSKAFKRLEKLGKKKNMRKPRKIPEGFEWDPKTKELIDTRCNNPKLRKLIKESVKVDFDKPAICISPFFTGTKKHHKSKKKK